MIPDGLKYFHKGKHALSPLRPKRRPIYQNRFLIDFDRLRGFIRGNGTFDCGRKKEDKVADVDETETSR